MAVLLLWGGAAQPTFFPFEDHEINLFGEVCPKAVKGGFFIFQYFGGNLEILKSYKSLTLLCLHGGYCLRYRS